MVLGEERGHELAAAGDADLGEDGLEVVAHREAGNAATSAPTARGSTGGGDTAGPPVGLALGIATLRRLRGGERRGTGLAVAGIVVGGVRTGFWALVATLLVVGILAAAVSPVPVPTGPIPTAPAPASAASPVPAPVAPESAATDPGVVSAAQLADGIGLPAGAVSCPSALRGRGRGVPDSDALPGLRVGRRLRDLGPG